MLITLQTVLKIILNNQLGTDLQPLLSKPRIPYYSMRLNIPQQQNGYDCGIYLLEYAERFMLNSKAFLDDQSLILYPFFDRLETVTIKVQKLLLENRKEELKVILEKNKAHIEEIRVLAKLNDINIDE